MTLVTSKEVANKIENSINSKKTPTFNFVTGDILNKFLGIGAVVLL